MKQGTLREHVARKASSGRWLFTVATAAVFIVLSCTGSLPASDVKAIILVVVTFYFTKRDTGTENT
ncbi:MAG: hypothetical protein HQ559_13595 [Lentisphaerae bacterium]|nr:hypothetical protein [Lentisphaerota bacterium]